MRQPTTRDKALAWHTAALERVKLHLIIEANPSDPQPGWYERRLVKGGVMVPARIWIAQAICPETGELTDDETLMCEVAGVEQDPFDQWEWLCGRPITEARYRYMVDLRAWAQKQDEYEPSANAREAVDFRKIKPAF